jgi:hypothetical protein
LISLKYLEKEEAGSLFALFALQVGEAEHPAEQQLNVIRQD